MTLTKRKSFKLGDIVRRFGGELIGDPGIRIRQVATLESARSTDITFVAQTQLSVAARSRPRRAQSYCGPDARDATSLPRIVCANPYAVLRQGCGVCSIRRAPWLPGVHKSAVVDKSARVGEISEHRRLRGHRRRRDKSVIGAIIGPGCFVGDNAVVGAGRRGCMPTLPSITSASIGARCIVHSGAVIGSDGFGIAKEDGVWKKIPQIGRVIIGDDVEIGANTTIDRGALDDTVIGDGVKLDNQIQIAHNVQIGANTAIAACIGIAGSAKIGRNCALGGASMIYGHITIADNVNVSAGTLIMKSLDEPGTYTGVYPFSSHQRWLKNAAHLRQLDDLVKRVRELEGRLGQGRGEANMSSMDIHQILEYLPHRYPFLLVDRVVSCEPGKSIVAIKNVTINEHFFTGHFPHHPVMPGVLIIEALAQAAAILTFKTHGHKTDDNSIYYFVGIDNARFKKPVIPGDTLELHAELKRFTRGIWWFDTHATSGRSSGRPKPN